MELYKTYSLFIWRLLDSAFQDLVISLVSCNNCCIKLTFLSLTNLCTEKLGGCFICFALLSSCFLVFVQKKSEMVEAASPVKIRRNHWAG